MHRQKQVMRVQHPLSSGIDTNGHGGEVERLFEAKLNWSLDAGH
jgi:hypothetical protein